MPEPIPEYFVSTGITGDSAPTFATYVRRPSGSLRRVCSPEMPLCQSRIEALMNLESWLWWKAEKARSDRDYDQYVLQAGLRLLEREKAQKEAAANA